MSKVKAAPRVAVIEDEKPVREYFQKHLIPNFPEIVIDEYEDLESAKTGLAANKYDLVITDIELGKSAQAKFAGVQILNLLEGTDVPVLVVSGLPERDAIDSEALKALFFSFSAWDYLEKPLNDAEFVIKVRQALSWRESLASAAHTAQPVSDPDIQITEHVRYPVKWKGEEVRGLAITQLNIVGLFLSRIEQNIPFEDLYPGIKSGHTKETLRQHIYRIKAAFKKKDPSFNRIKDVRMVGYKWTLAG